MSCYDNELRQLQQQVKRRAYLENRLSDLRTQNTQLNSKTAQLLAIKVNEQADVDRLEGRSLAAFFYKVAGKKDEKLDKEREEAYAAAVKYDVAVREHEAVKSDIEFCLKELKELTGCEEKYRQLLEQKKASVKISSSEQAERIIALEERLAALENREKEINEAIFAGREAEKFARQARLSIVEARNHGTWDMLGGGLLADLAKHSALDEAQELIEQLQIRLRRFNTELSDIDINTDIRVCRFVNDVLQNQKTSPLVVKALI